MGKLDTSISALGRALLTFHTKADGTIPVRTAAVFFLIADYERRGDEIDQTEVGRVMGLESAAVTRDVGILSKFSRGKDGGGLELVESRMDLRDRRRRLLSLSTKGRKLIEEIERRANA